MKNAISIAWCGPTCDYWQWIVNHFSSLRCVPNLFVDELLCGDDSPRDSAANELVMVIASDDRQDQKIWELVERTASGDCTGATDSTRWCVLLGPDWVGHRRTRPLPEAWNTFYWYELYDRWIPWLFAGTEKNPNVQSKLGGGSKRPNPRTIHWIDAVTKLEKSKPSDGEKGLALVVAETESTRSLWTDLLVGRNISCVGVTPNRLDLWMEPKWVIVDLEQQPVGRTGGAQKQCELEHTVTRIARQFPSSLIAVADPFPRWERWQRLMELGAHVPFGKPYFVHGLLDTMSRFKATI